MPLRGLSAARFERRGQPLASRRKFLIRMAIAIGLWMVLTIVGLAIGIAGYAAFEGMSFVDAYVNAAMILSGMGPVGELKTTGGKVFAGSYAILSGLIIVIATGFVLAPIFHRILHSFHVETTKEGGGRSLRLAAGGFDDLGPFLGLRRDESAEFLRRVPLGDDAHGVEARRGFRLLQVGDQCRVERVYDRLRRARAGGESLPSFPPTA